MSLVWRVIARRQWRNPDIRENSKISVVLEDHLDGLDKEELSYFSVFPFLHSIEGTLILMDNDIIIVLLAISKNLLKTLHYYEYLIFFV